LPFIHAAAYLIGLAVENWIGRVHLATAGTRPWLVTVGWIAIVVGAAVVASGIVSFRLARTAIIPFHPAPRLVRRGHTSSRATRCTSAWQFFTPD
jgi:hypothetical protein